MFSRPSDEHPSKTAAIAAAQQKTRIQSSAIPSIIGSDITVSGNLVCTGEIQIDGRVEGDVRCANLVIGDEASVHGEIIAEQATVCGRVHGTIRARKILLAPTCHVEGSLLYETLTMEPGAYFDGNCRHSENPLTDDVTVSEAASTTSHLQPVAVSSSRHYSALAHEPVTVLAKLPPLGETDIFSTIEAQQDCGAMGHLDA